MDIFNEIIEKIGNELDIKVTHLSDNWVNVLEKNREIHYIQGYKFDLNNHGIGNIIDDKGLFNDLLVYKKIPCVYQKVIFNDYKREDVLDFFNKNNREIIIKGNIGTCGKEVYKVDNEIDLFNVIDKLFLSQFSLSLSPYIEAKSEYRVIILNNDVRVIYGKIKPFIIGDGIHTIYELAIKFNDYYKENKDKLKNPNYIPKVNEKIILNYQFNLSNGALMFQEIENNLKERLITLAKIVSNNLNITFGSIDIFETSNNELLVLEANSGVMMNNFIKQNSNGYDIAYNLYKDAIKLMFNIK